MTRRLLLLSLLALVACTESATEPAPPPEPPAPEPRFPADAPLFSPYAFSRPLSFAGVIDADVQWDPDDRMRLVKSGTTSAPVGVHRITLQVVGVSDFHTPGGVVDVTPALPSTAEVRGAWNDSTFHVTVHGEGSRITLPRGLYPANAVLEIRDAGSVPYAYTVNAVMDSARVTISNASQPQKGLRMAYVGDAPVLTMNRAEIERLMPHFRGWRVRVSFSSPPWIYVSFSGQFENPNTGELIPPISFGVVSFISFVSPGFTSDVREVRLPGQPWILDVLALNEARWSLGIMNPDFLITHGPPAWISRMPRGEMSIEFENILAPLDS